MCLWRLLLSVSLLCLMGRGESKTHYLFLTPTMLKSGETGKICVDLENLEEPVDLVVDLEMSGKNTSIFSEDVSPPSFHQCNDFTAPPMSEPTPVFLWFSATGQNTKILDRKTVVVQPTENMYLIQMDKPGYKVGQTLGFRIISLDSNLKPVKTTYSAIYIQDPTSSRLIQWKDQVSDHGIVDFSFKLSEEAPSGYYTITAERSSGSSTSESFLLEEYILPRFSVSLQCPSTLSVMQEALPFNFSAEYTYGQSVPGKVTARCCAQINVYGMKRNCYKNLNENCLNITGKTDADGKFSGVFDIKSFGLGLLGSQVSFVMDVILTEDGTGHQTKESCYAWVTSQLANLRFDYESMKQHYKRMIDYPARVILTDERGQPLAGEVIDFEIDGQEIRNATTDDKGVATYVIDTSNLVAENFTIKASYRRPDQCYYVEWYGYGGDRPEYPTAEYLVQRYYSASGSFLQIQNKPEVLSCSNSYSFDVSYVFTPAGKGKEACQEEEDKTREITVRYVVMGRAKLLQDGQTKVDVSNSMNGMFSIDLSIDPGFAPSSSMVVYVLWEDELVVDVIGLNIEKCFQNQVSLTFSEEVVAPGSNVDVQVTAAPISLCGLRVLDASLFILYPYEPFNADRIFYSLPYMSLYGYYVGEFNLEEADPGCEDPNKLIFYNGHYYYPTSTRFEGDTYKTLKAIGLIAGTNSNVRKPVVCGKEDEEVHPRPIPFSGGENMSFSKVAADGAGAGAGGGFGGGGGALVTLRKNFAETMLWTLVNTDSEGRATIPVVVPDTITEWKGSAMCTSENEGFGMTPFHVNMTTFLPFFMDMSMPSTFTRGETMVIISSVSNYLGQCIKVSVVLQSSKDFTAELQIANKNQNPKKVKKNVKMSDVCICHNQKTSFKWHIQAKKIGDISIVASAVTSHIGQTCDGPSDPSQRPRNDTVIHTVRVEPEGIRKEETSTHLVCVQDTTTEVPISIPALKNIVPDSSSSSVTVFGDILSLSANFLENMIQLPTGCAEQTISRMAVIPPVLDYLNSTSQLKKELLERAKNFLTEGYYRHLRFRQSSGCYTPFESSGGRFNNFQSSCNSWLTARCFVVLEKVKQYTYVDENIVQQSLIFLSQSQQLDTGCFKHNGYLFWAQDEKEDVITYNAMLATALLQSNYSLGDTLLEGALTCIRSAYTSGEVSLYNKAFIGYVFAVAGAEDERVAVLNEMKSKAISEGGRVHWERQDMPKREPGQVFPSPFAPVEMQIAAYVLLTMVKSPSITEEDKNYMVQIVRWIVQYQNAKGGFRSTQDTELAMQALAEFAKLIHFPDSKNTVRVNSENGQIAQFDVDQENRLVVQSKVLPSVSGKYTFTVSGKGCCLIQNTVRYNVPVPKENAAFAFSIASSSKNCLSGVAFTMTLNVTMRYDGMKNASDMAIIDLKLLSGYQGDYASLSKLKEEKTISKWQEKDNHLILYFESVARETSTFSFDLVMGRQVLNIKDGSGVIYNYYETGENGYASYRNPCAA